MIKYINRLARYYHHKGEKVNFEKLDMQSYQHKKCKWAIGAVQKDKDPHFHSNRYILDFALFFIYLSFLEAFKRKSTTM